MAPDRLRTVHGTSVLWRICFRERSHVLTCAVVITQTKRSGCTKQHSFLIHGSLGQLWLCQVLVRLGYAGLQAARWVGSASPILSQSPDSSSSPACHPGACCSHGRGRNTTGAGGNFSAWNWHRVTSAHMPHWSKPVPWQISKSAVVGGGFYFSLNRSGRKRIVNR